MRRKIGTTSRLLLATLLGLSLILGACHKRPRLRATPPSPDYFVLGEGYYEAGDYAQAAQAYQSYLRNNPSAANQDKVLFRLAMAHAFPESPVRNLPKAMQLLQQLVRLFPQSSPFKPQAEFLLRLQEEVERLRANISERDERIRELTRELERLKQIDMQRRPSRPPP